MTFQGDVFQKIIDEIVQASQADFEENGVNQQTLVELQQVSCLLLSPTTAQRPSSATVICLCARSQQNLRIAK